MTQLSGIKQPVNGIILLDKPYQITSNSALQQVRRLFQAEKAGHTGTLDPMATGLLPICLGEATKFSSFLLEGDKRYTATILFGRVTTTGDKEGDDVIERPVNIDETMLFQVLMHFTGEIWQVPPMYSALKVQGKALYKYAREGVEIERKPRSVTVYSIDLMSFDGYSAVIDVCCSKGTYIRVLAQDIGEMLGCGAHLTALHRTGTAGFDSSKSVTLEQLSSLSLERRYEWLMPVDTIVSHLPLLFLSQELSVKFCHGQAVHIFEKHDIMAEYFRVYSKETDKFLGLASLDADCFLRPTRLMRMTERDCVAAMR